MNTSIQSILGTTSIAQLDAEILLANVLQKNRTWIAGHPEYELSEKEVQKWEKYEQRRIAREPIAYITNKKEFYGRDFYVDSRVLIPRPSTEGLVNLTLDFFRTGKEEVREVDTDIIVFSKKFQSLAQTPTLIDLCSGSGCIAITLALELPEVKIIATDISRDALNVAQKNTEMHEVAGQIEFREGYLLDPISNLKEPFILISNPPYIPDTEELMDDVIKYEPHRALFGGTDGGTLVREIMESARDHPLCMGLVIECRRDHL